MNLHYSRNQLFQLTHLPSLYRRHWLFSENKWLEPFLNKIISRAMPIFFTCGSLLIFVLMEGNTSCIIHWNILCRLISSLSFYGIFKVCYDDIDRSTAMTTFDQTFFLNLSLWGVTFFISYYEFITPLAKNQWKIVNFEKLKWIMLKIMRYLLLSRLV